MSPLSRSPDALNSSLVQCVGHSLVTGYGLDDASLRASCRLAGIFGSAQEWNQSIAGAVLGWVDADMASPQLNSGGISWLANRITRYPKLAPYDAASDVVLMQFGKNDMAVVGQTVVNGAAPTAQGLSIYQHSLKTAIQLFRASSRHYLGATGASSGLGTWDKTITLPAGVWTAAPNGTPRVGIKGASNISGSDGYRTTPTTSAQVVISIPSDFQGTAVTPLYVMFVANPATTAATITASGAATGTYDLKAGDYGGALGGGVCGTADNTFSPTKRNLVVWRFTGAAIAAGAGTLTLTTSAITGGNWGFAEWGIEAETPPLIAVLDISRDLVNGVGSSALYSQSTDALHVTWNAGVQTVINEFRTKDSYTNYVPVDALIGGNGQSGERGTLNGAITTGSPANGGTLNVTSTTGAWPTTGTLAVNSTGGVEFISWTGQSGTAALSGVTRGAYGSTILAAPNAAQVGQIADTTKIQNFSNDMVHWSERAQSLVAQEVYQKLRPFLSDLRRTSRTVGPGRVDTRCIVSSNITNQLLNPGQATPILFDVQYIDTANMHEPSGTSSSTTPNSRVFIKSDGLYAVSASVVFSMGKVMSANGVAAAGKRYVAIRRNGLVVSYQIGYPTWQDQNIYATTYVTNSPPPMELRAGDYIDVVALADGFVTNTTLTTANAVTTAPNTYVVGTTLDLMPNDFVKIDSELMQVGNIISATQFIAVRRGSMGTTAAAHNSTGVAISGGWNIGKATTLNGALTNSATSVPITTAASFVNGDYVRVDDEAMLVTAGGLTATLTVTRGQLGTTAVSHLTLAPIYSGIGVTSVAAAGMPNTSPTLSLARLQAI